MRTIGAIIVIVLGVLPALFAGFPDLAPAWFRQTVGGVPLSVVFMSVVMLVFVVLAGLFAGAKATRTVSEREAGQ